MHPKNLEVGVLFGQCYGFKIFTGALYLGGYTKDEKSKGNWLKKRTEKWERKFVRSPQRRRNILRKVTPHGTVKSNHSGYFCNT